MLYCMRYRLLLVALTVMLPGWLWAEPIVVQQVETELHAEQYLLDATINFEFNETVLEALEHGVPLTIVLQVQVVRRDAWFWEPDVVNLRLYRVLRYHALTRLYEVQDLQYDRTQSFAVRDIAFAELGEIQALPVAKKSQLTDKEDYMIELHVSLDIESLPLTLRPLAYLTSDWNLSSDWHIHPLAQLLDTSTL
jgi:hypothetical protein